MAFEVEPESVPIAINSIANAKYKMQNTKHKMLILTATDYDF